MAYHPPTRRIACSTDHQQLNSLESCKQSYSFCHCWPTRVENTITILHIVPRTLTKSPLDQKVIDSVCSGCGRRGGRGLTDAAHRQDDELLLLLLLLLPLL